MKSPWTHGTMAGIASVTAGIIAGRASSDVNVGIATTASVLTAYSALLAVFATRQAESLETLVRDLRDIAASQRLVAIYGPITEWRLALDAGDVQERASARQRFAAAMNAYQPRLTPLPNCDHLRTVTAQGAPGGGEGDLVLAALFEVGDALWGKDGTARPRV